MLFNGGPGRVEVQCFNAPDSTNPTGSFYGIAPAERVLSRDQEWFLLQIFNRGSTAEVLVNGEAVSHARDLNLRIGAALVFNIIRQGAAYSIDWSRLLKLVRLKS